MSWSFVVTSAILVAMNWIPGLKLRTTEDDEIGGMDEAEIGEFAVSIIVFLCFLFLNQKPGSFFT